MADLHNEPVAVIGLGRFGSALAHELIRLGTEVLAIDDRPKIVQSLAGQLPHVVAADATDIEALRQLGVDNFSSVIVAIGTDLEDSILVTSLLAELEIPDIWAKAVSPQHATILSRVGAHHVVAPEHDMGERVAHLLSGRVLDYVEVDEDFAMIKTRPPGDIVGIPLQDSRLRAKYHVTVVAVKSEVPPPGRPSVFTHATGDTILMHGDLILVVGRIDAVERFAAID